jgi:hypothetical protein
LSRVLLSSRIRGRFEVVQSDGCGRVAGQSVGEPDEVEQARDGRRTLSDGDGEVEVGALK